MDGWDLPSHPANNPAFTESSYDAIASLGYWMNPDLEFVGEFFLGGAAIGDLKSTKSKNFNFRTEVALERDIPMEWYNYQKDVMESGALGGGDAGNNPTDPVDSDSGDYKGY